MASQYAPRWPASAVTLLAVLAVVLAVVGLVVSLVSTDTLFLGSAWTVPAVISVGVVALTLALVVFAGGPSERWERTPYW